ncbi:MAG: glucose-1-phosphate adenylyltransferase [Roseiflexaceae bacterium]
MRVVALIMAGGEGARLSVLSEKRAKPSVPFAGKFRIIDFPLSNCVNSGIFDVAVLTQYQPHSLNGHIGNGRPWDLDRGNGGVQLLQPYQGRNEEGWYQGTSDAVLQNLNYIRERRADLVVILSGDHIYKMDYAPMIAFHQQQKADLTVGVMNVPLDETDRFGIMTVNEQMKVVEFTEKPKKRDKGTLASMGIYVFSADALIKGLTTLDNGVARTDFGKHVIPSMVANDNVVAYPFEGYWVDVGTIDSYWRTSMEMIDPAHTLNLYDPSWVIHTRSEERAPAKIGPQAMISQSMVCNGCTIRGTVERSVLSPGVYVSPGAIVRDSVIMTDTWIGPGAVLDKVIVDKQVVIGAGAVVGYGDDMTTPNEKQPDKVNTGISVIGKGAHIPAACKIGRNVVIGAERTEEEFPSLDIRTGMTV